MKPDYAILSRFNDVQLEISIEQRTLGLRFDIFFAGCITGVILLGGIPVLITDSQAFIDESLVVEYFTLNNSVYSDANSVTEMDQ
jgi:hypothetical protein